jgi:hypothetical protein
MLSHRPLAFSLPQELAVAPMCSACSNVGIARNRLVALGFREAARAARRLKMLLDSA